MIVASQRCLFFTEGAKNIDYKCKEASLRKGWVKVGLIVDLSALTTSKVESSALKLKETWSTNWQSIENKQQSVEAIFFQLKSRVMK